jgi:hypothetical protein
MTRSCVADPGCLSWIPDPIIFPSQIQGWQDPGFGSATMSVFLTQKILNGFEQNIPFLPVELFPNLNILDDVISGELWAAAAALCPRTNAVRTNRQEGNLHTIKLSFSAKVFYSHKCEICRSEIKWKMENNTDQELSLKILLHQHLVKLFEGKYSTCFFSLKPMFFWFPRYGSVSQKHAV